jgi:hypothetical protein
VFGDYDWPEEGRLPSGLQEMQKLQSRLKGGCGQDWPPHMLGHGSETFWCFFVKLMLQQETLDIVSFSGVGCYW